MRTVYSEGEVTIRRDPACVPGGRYVVIGDLSSDDNAMLAILLDRAAIADAKEKTPETQARLSALKGLNPGNDGRGRDVVKRGPYKTKANK